MNWCPFCQVVEGELHANDCVLLGLDAPTTKRVMAEYQIDNILDNLRPEDRVKLIRRLVTVYNVDSPR